MHAFNSKMKLAEMIAKIDHEDPSDMCTVMMNPEKIIYRKHLNLRPQVVFLIFLSLFFLSEVVSF